MALQQLAIGKENIASRLPLKAAAKAPLIQIQKKAAFEEIAVNRKLVDFKKPLQKGEPDKKKVVVTKPAVHAKPVLQRQESKKPQVDETLSLKPEPEKSVLPEVQKPKDSSFSSKQLGKGDSSSKNEPHTVPEYVADIYDHLRDLEAKYPIKKDFLEGHPTTPKMRAILVNWLVDVHQNFKLYLETLHLTITLVDRYLQTSRNVEKNVLQLVGTAALFIASKYEEMYLPQTEEFVYISDNAFTTRQLLLIEIDILKKLDFSLGRPLSIHFLRRYSKVAQADVDQYTLGKYLLELSLLAYEMSHIPPSLLAAAACCLSIALCTEVMEISKVWTPTLISCSTYKYSDIKPAMILLADALNKSETSKYQMVRKKYASAKFEKISLDYRLKGPLVRKLANSKK